VHPHRTRCAVLLQSAWRGYRTRQVVSKMRRMHYFSGKGSAQGRRKYFVDEVSKVTRKLRVQIDHSQARIDALMEELDASTDKARKMMADTMDAVRSRHSRQLASIEREFGPNTAAEERRRRDLHMGAIESQLRSGQGIAMGPSADAASSVPTSGMSSAAAREQAAGGVT